MQYFYLDPLNQSGDPIKILKIAELPRIRGKSSCLKHTTQKQNKQKICPVTGVQLICEIFMNDLLTEQGQQRSRFIW